MAYKILILQGSPRPRGNTATFLEPFEAELRAAGAEVQTIRLYGKTITPCDACWTCQNVPDAPGCLKDDDMAGITRAVLGADVLVLATPIYSWYCTPPMKAVLDRFYAMNKYYGSAPEQRLWADLKIAVVATCGYDVEYGAGPFETGVRRLCEHSRIPFIGMLAERDLDDQASFRTPDAIAASRAFARRVLAACAADGKDGAAAAYIGWEKPNQGFPILEYDPEPEAVIHATRLLDQADVPECCVITFFRDLVERMAADGRLRPTHALRAEDGTNTIYEMAVDGRRIAVAHCKVGGPQAAAMLEETAALGCRRFVACGGAGVLRKDIAVGHLIVPVAAVRDEGTSYHYLPPSREVALDPAAVRAVCDTLDAAGVPYLAGKTWTTDAFYRETPAKVERRRGEGCLTVEMECASFAAAARFRGLMFAQILYGGDDLSGVTWDSRRWQSRDDIREGVFRLACEACLRLG